MKTVNLSELPQTEEQLYEDWLMQKVEDSIVGLADGSNRTYTQDEWQAVKAARAARRKGA